MKKIKNIVRWSKGIVVGAVILALALSACGETAESSEQSFFLVKEPTEEEAAGSTEQSFFLVKEPEKEENTEASAESFFLVKEPEQGEVSEQEEIFVQKENAEEEENGNTVSQISIARYTTVAVMENHTLWLWGFHLQEALRDNLQGKFIDYMTEPVQIMTDVKCAQISDNTLAVIKTDDSLWMLGGNYAGQVGNGTTEIVSEPVRIMEDVREVSVSETVTLAVKNDGTLWAWGNNEYGTVGDGTTKNRLEPKQILSDVRTAKAGSSHCAAVKNDGSLWMWGRNLDGEIGIGSVQSLKLEPEMVMNDVIAVSLSSEGSAAVTSDHVLCLWGTNMYEGVKDRKNFPLQIMEGVEDVSLGTGTYVLKTDGSLWYWVNNTISDRYSEPEKEMENIQTLVPSSGTVFAVIDKEGQVWMWGNNDLGQLGNGEIGISTDEPVRPVLP